MFHRLPAYAAASVLKIQRTPKRRTGTPAVTRVDVAVLGALGAVPRACAHAHAQT